jgi:hypothetical protein
VRSLGLFDALDRDLDFVDPAADPAIDLSRDLRVGLEELLGRLAALAEAGLVEGEPGAGATLFLTTLTRTRLPTDSVPVLIVSIRRMSSRTVA